MLDESAHRSQRPREFWAKCPDMETCLVHYLDSFFLGHTKTILHNGRNLLYYIVTFKQQTTMKNPNLLTFLMAFAAAWIMIPVHAKDYDIKVEGKMITSSNYTAITAANGFTAIKSGTVTYDPATRTLTLSNAVIETTQKNGRGIHVPEGTESLYTIRFMGDNSISTTDGAAISGDECPLHIVGDGRLTMTVPERNAGIFAFDDLMLSGGITIESNGRIRSYAGKLVLDGIEAHVADAGNAAAFKASKGIELKGGSTVTFPADAVIGLERGEYTFLDGETACTEVTISRTSTGIEPAAVYHPAHGQTVYTLQGMRLVVPFDRLTRGLYIVDGRKVMKP